MAVGHAFHADGLLEMVARARRRAIGSMFPSLLPESRGSRGSRGGGGGG